MWPNLIIIVLAAFCGICFFSLIICLKALWKTRQMLFLTEQQLDRQKKGNDVGIVELNRVLAENAKLKKRKRARRH